MTVRVYRSSDASAPTFTNTAGSIIGILDACLVSGYGAKTAAGWTKAYSGTNVAAYKQGALATYNQYYLRVDNTLTTAALMTGYETMSDVNTGTNPFPVSYTNGLTGLYWIQPNSAGAKDWIVIATERTVYFWGSISVSPPFDANGLAQFYMFGDFTSLYGADDKYNCLLAGATNTSISTSIWLYYLLSSSASGNSRITVARSFDGFAPAVPALPVADYRYAYINTGNSSGASDVAFPNLADNKILVCPIYISNPASSSYPETNILRGQLPGLYMISNGQTQFLPPTQSYSFSTINHGQTLTIPSMPGKTLEVVNSTGVRTITRAHSSWLFETSDTW